MRGVVIGMEAGRTDAAGRVAAEDADGVRWVEAGRSGAIGRVETDRAGVADPSEANAGPPGLAARKRAAVELIRNHGALLRSTARRYSLCADDADDACQRGFEILLEKAPSTDPRQLVPWARTVIKHEALAIRSERERILDGPARLEPVEGQPDWVQLIPSGRDGPEELVGARERIARSREALGRLKPQELKALTQLAEGYSYAEIGAMNRWTRTKVNRCLAEGRERFRSAFRESETGERCAAVAPLLSASCDGELEQGRLAEVEDHLAGCGSCRATLRAYRAAPRAAAALLPALPVSRGLWDRLQELVVSFQLRLQSVGADPAGAGVSSAGAARGALPAAAVKVAAVCAGTAGTAAVCVATGVLPAPLVHHRPARTSESPPAKVARPAPATGTVPAAASPRTVVPVAPDRAIGRSADVSKPTASTKSERTRSRPQSSPTPAPTATEAEFTPEASGTPVQAAASPPRPAPAPAPVPAPASTSSGGGSGGGGGGGSGGGGVPVGGGGGEFGP